MNNKKPTVCQILHSLHMGGAEVLAARLARCLRPDYRFVFICLDELGALGQELRTEGIPVFVLDRKAGLDWKCAWKLASLLQTEKVDLVHAHQYTPFFYALVGRCLQGGPAILFTEHGRHFPDHPRPRRIWFNRLMLQRRDHVVGVGQAVRQALIRNEGLPARRVGVIYNGVSLLPFSNGTDARREVRRSLGLGEHGFVVIQVARLDYLKDHRTAIRTIERVVRQRSDAHLLLVGDGPEQPVIQREIKSRGLESNVHLLGMRTDVPRLLRAADVFLLTSISEGIPVTLIEAMAAGLPVVATAVGGVPEVVAASDTGFLAPAGDDAALAGLVLELAQDAPCRGRLGRLAHQRAQNLFSQDRMHAAYHRQYSRMLA